MSLDWTGCMVRLNKFMCQFVLHLEMHAKILREREPSPEAFSGASHTQEVRLWVPRPPLISGESRTRGAGRYSLRSADVSGLSSAELFRAAHAVSMQQVRREDRALA
jgi:hypothetical protein